LGIEGEYTRFEVNEDGLNVFLQSIKGQGWSGFSLTMPLKEQVLQLGFECDARASRITSGNTLIAVGDSYMVQSTDVSAFDRLLAGKKIDRVAVIGGGGTARAALGALDGLVDDIDIIQRSSHRNNLLKSCVVASKINFLNFTSTLHPYDVVISTTPVGASDIFAKSLPENPQLLIEALYKPNPTALSAAWSSAGGIVLDGIDLLVEQGLDQISLMSSQHFDYAPLRVALLEHMRSAQPQH
jgi:shikimate dehydrogenase